MVVAFVKPPDVPVTVTVAGPVAAVLLAANVKVLVPVVLVGLNAAVTPLGNPVDDKLTLPLNPFTGLTVMVLAPLVPCTIVKLPGDAERP
jgi:membrane-associated protease RseP (regulator of RpoE activity)